MHMGFRVFLTAGLVFAVLAMSAAPAAADLRVAMLDIEGSRSEGLTQDVSDLIRDIGHKLIKAKVYRDAAKRLRKKKLNAEHVRKVCEFLQIDAVVFGTINAERGKYVFSLMVREGRTGKLVKTLTLKLKDAELSAAIKKKLRARLIHVFDDITPIAGGGTVIADEGDEGGGAEEEDEEEEEVRVSAKERKRKEQAERKERERKERAERKERERAERAERKERARKEREARKEKARAERERKERERKEKANAGAKDDDEADEEEEEEEEVAAADEGNEDGDKDADEDADEDEDEDEDEERGGKVAKATADDDDADSPRASADDDVEISRDQLIRGAPARAFLGFSGVLRRLTFTEAAGLADDQRPQGYDGGIVPGVYLTGELYPMAFARKSRSALSDVGVGFVVDKVLKINATVDNMGTLVERPISQMRWGVDLRYRLNFGDEPTSPTLFLSAGYSKMSFVIDRGDLDRTVLELPDTDYTWLDPRIGMRLPIGQRFAIFGSVAGLVVLKAGEFTDGQNYGESTILGIDGDLIFEARVTEHVLVSLGAHATGLGFNFAGTGDLTDRDGDPATEDVGGALDLVVSSFAMVGYSY